jgi:hypothetical protein
MENTLTIDGGLYEELRLRAEAEEMPIEQFADEVIRAGIKSADKRRLFRQETHAMGALVNIDKVGQVDAEMEAEEFIRKINSGQ